MREQIFPRPKLPDSEEGSKKKAGSIKAIGTRFGEVRLSDDDVVEAGNSVGKDFTELTSKDDQKLN